MILTLLFTLMVASCTRDTTGTWGTTGTSNTSDTIGTCRVFFFLNNFSLGSDWPSTMEHAVPHHMHTALCINGKRKWFTMSYKTHWQCNSSLNLNQSGQKEVEVSQQSSSSSLLLPMSDKLAQSVLNLQSQDCWVSNIKAPKRFLDFVLITLAWENPCSTSAFLAG